MYLKIFMIKLSTNRKLYNFILILSNVTHMFLSAVNFCVYQSQIEQLWLARGSWLLRAVIGWCLATIFVNNALRNHEVHVNKDRIIQWRSKFIITLQFLLNKITKILQMWSFYLLFNCWIMERLLIFWNRNK